MNDPLVGGRVAASEKAPRPDRPEGRARFGFLRAFPEQVYDLPTPEFVYWQCREAALSALEAWESIRGEPQAAWCFEAENPLKVLLAEGQRPDALYDRQSISFFSSTVDGRAVHSAASTDVVSHEVGHALLDALRPDLWDCPFIEVAAFHEAFGDCMALLTALSEPAVRRTLLEASPDLSEHNFVETVAEEVADAIRRSSTPGIFEASPRRAMNTFVWQHPATIPLRASPEILSSEPHSFSRIMTGCFYDLLRNIHLSQPERDDAGLWTAAQSAGRLLIVAAQRAAIEERFFLSLARAMLSGSANQSAQPAAIIDAFRKHGVDIAPTYSSMPAPTSFGCDTLPGAGSIEGATPRDRSFGRAKRGSSKDRTAFTEGPQRFRELSVASLDRRLRDVVVRVPVVERVIPFSDGALPFDAPPPSSPTISTEEEALSFVNALLEGNRIALDAPEVRFRNAKRGRTRAQSPESIFDAPIATHAIRGRQGKKTLVRLRFLCR
ncbi:hypothetical protein [Sorangium sp. So ce1000]|uniref:hypothetical protein n=1 Tax=Sorangium sp. So ce1000 TaxID=3133325 RepID=UPI003F6276DB